jgi:hypothetical protein
MRVERRGKGWCRAERDTCACECVHVCVCVCGQKAGGAKVEGVELGWAIVLSFDECWPKCRESVCVSTVSVLLAHA